MTKACRGDLIAVSRISHSYVQAQARVESERVELGTITSITLDGIAKAWIPCSSNTPRALDRRIEAWKILEAARLDTDAVLAMARGRRWRPDLPAGANPMPFGSEQELRAAIRPYLRLHIANLPWANQ